MTQIDTSTAYPRNIGGLGDLSKPLPAPNKTKRAADSTHINNRLKYATMMGGKGSTFSTEPLDLANTDRLSNSGAHLPALANTVQQQMSTSPLAAITRDQPIPKQKKVKAPKPAKTPKVKQPAQQAAFGANAMPSTNTTGSQATQPGGSWPKPNMNNPKYAPYSYKANNTTNNPPNAPAPNTPNQPAPTTTSTKTARPKKASQGSYGSMPQQGKTASGGLISRALEFHHALTSSHHGNNEKILRSYHQASTRG